MGNASHRADLAGKIYWRRLPKHGKDQGLVGIPYDREGFRLDETRFYILDIGEGKFCWSCDQWMPGIEIADDWISNGEGYCATQDEGKDRCQAEWSNLLDADATMPGGNRTE